MGRIKFPSIGGVPRSPGPARRVAWVVSGGVVRECRTRVLNLLSPRGLTTGPRLLKFRATRGQIYNDHIFYIPHILNLNLLTQLNKNKCRFRDNFIYLDPGVKPQDDKEKWSRQHPTPRMTENTTERVSTRVMTTPPACHPRKLSFSRGPICRHPSAEGNPAFVSLRNKFPSIEESLDRNGTY